tara:strand:- start:2739 stop:6575 length:3837 start_codon:yes stop_codon:yes gene_type:complete
MGSKGQSGMKSAIERFSNQSNRKLLASSFRKGSNVKSTKNYVAIDPATKQLITGNLSQISKKLGTSASTIKSRFKKGKSQFKDIKGFQLVRFPDDVSKVNFINNWNTTDAKVLKPKAKPITSGMKYIEALQPSFSVKSAGFHENKKWGTAEHRYELDLKGEGLTKNQLEQIFAKTSLQTIQEQKLKAKDKIRVVIKDPNLKSGFVSIPLMDVKDFSVNKIFKVFEEVVESNEKYEISNDTQLVFTSVNMANSDFLGSYSPNIHKLNVQMKKSIIQIKNKDNMCVARAVATGKCRVDYGVNSKEYDNCKRGRKIQEQLAKELLEDCGLPARKLCLEDIKHMEHYSGYQITIIDGDDYNNIYYPDVNSKTYHPPEDDTQTIYLYKHKGHVDLIANNRVAGFFGKANFCHKCKKCYKDKEKHKCSFKCNMCCRCDCPAIHIPKAEKKFFINCASCDRYFPCKECYDNHLKPDKKGKSVCDKVWKCQKCKKVLSRETQPPETHECGDYHCSNCKRIVRKEHRCFMYPKRLKPPSEKYIYFDFEADISGEQHEVMYSVSMYQHDDTPVIHEDINEFCKWAFQPNHKGYTFIAHNGKGYDYQFVIRWVYANTDYQPFIIFGGQKINYMSIKELNIRFIDSLSFLTMPLKAFPKTFGEKELKKGFFPHWFNTKENWSYVGKMPDADFFKYNSFKEKDRNEFIKWYNQKVKEGYVWNQKKEMMEYCISDVDILRKCCIKFRQLYIDVAEIDPFQYLTIASVCMSIYKYHYVDLSYPDRCKYFDEVWTGDPSKYPDDLREEYNKSKKAFDDTTIDIVEREQKIGIIPFKETEFIRKSFFGGRTNATKLIYHFKEGEEGKYSDITSLYPTVNYYDKYPLGHYTILDNQHCSINQYDILKKIRKEFYFGFIDCCVECPRNLYHPVLPRKGNKLFFDLDDKRGVWCSNELYNAQRLGYKITKVFEIRYYTETTTELFKPYVSKFLKIKQESSGFPLWVKTEEDKDKYIQDYQDRQGIKLDKDKIVENPGLRAIAKLCLNSLWGKFGQRTNMGKCDIVKTKDEFFKIIFNDKYQDINWIDLGNEKLQVSYSIKDEFVENDFNTSIAVASFTTSSARCRLYYALNLLQKQVLYFDTDSVVYKHNPNDPESKYLENGDLLGDWTDELDGNKMVGIFVSGGPKNYSYETEDYKKGKYVGNSYHTKVKGFNLNYEVSQGINHISMIDLVKCVLQGEDKKIKVGYDMIKRGKGHILSNDHQEKNYGLVYDKRSIMPPDEYGNYDTLPFGFQQTIKY